MFDAVLGQQVPGQQKSSASESARQRRPAAGRDAGRASAGQAVSDRCADSFGADRGPGGDISGRRHAVSVARLGGGRPCSAASPRVSLRSRRLERFVEADDLAADLGRVRFGVLLQEERRDLVLAASEA